MLRMILCCLFLLPVLLPAAYAQDNPTAPILVTTRELPRGFLFTEDTVLGDHAAVRIVQVPQYAIPAGTLNSPTNLVGTLLRTDLPPEQPIAQHYLLPHPKIRPNLEAPPPIAPSGYTVIQEYGTFTEVLLEDLEHITIPAKLAAGDTVDIVYTTSAENPLIDETQFAMRNLVIARVTEEHIAFSVHTVESNSLMEILYSGVRLTLLIHAPNDTPLNSVPPVITWDYLTSKEAPLVIPNGADFSALSGEN